MNSNLNKKKIIIVVCMTAVLVWAMPLVVHSLTKDKEEIKSISNKSTIIIDRNNIITYTEYTDRVDLASSNGITLEEANQIKDSFNDNRLSLISDDRNKKVAERLAEEKRIAEEKAKKAAEEKARLAKIAEEKRQLELAQAAEKKRLAELEAKRVAKNKAKEEDKKVTVSRGNNNNDEEGSGWIQFEATHYTAFCNTGCVGKTALGWDVSNTIYRSGYRIIAVDPNVIPLGSLVEVKTPYGTFTALAGDTGGRIKNYIVDILVADHGEAVRLGRITAQVKILK